MKGMRNGFTLTNTIVIASEREAIQWPFGLPRGFAPRNDG
jgi:hypothetical protein